MTDDIGVLVIPKEARIEIGGYWALSGPDSLLRIDQKRAVESLIGESSQQLTYMLAWDSMAERAKRWSAFIVDPEWIATSAETEKDGQLVQDISNQSLAPTTFSSVK